MNLYIKKFYREQPDSNLFMHCMGLRKRTGHKIFFIFVLFAIIVQSSISFAETSDDRQSQGYKTGNAYTALVEKESNIRPWHLRVGAGFNQMLVRHKSFNILREDDSLVMGRLELSGEMVVWRDLAVGVSGVYHGTAMRSSLFEDFDVSTNVHGFSLTAFTGYTLWEFLFPYVRAGFLGSWVELALQGELGNTSKRSFAPGFTASGGVELRLPRRLALPWLTGGLRLEAGYTYLGKFSFSSHEETDSLVDENWSEFGTLTLRGASFGISVFASF